MDYAVASFVGLIAEILAQFIILLQRNKAVTLMKRHSRESRKICLLEYLWRYSVNFVTVGFANPSDLGVTYSSIKFIRISEKLCFA